MILIDKDRMQLMQTGAGQYALTGATVKAKKPSWKTRRNPAWDETNDNTLPNSNSNNSATPTTKGDKHTWLNILRYHYFIRIFFKRSTLNFILPFKWPYFFYGTNRHLRLLVVQ